MGDDTMAPGLSAERLTMGGGGRDAPPPPTVPPALLDPEAVATASVHPFPDDLAPTMPETLLTPQPAATVGNHTHEAPDAASATVAATAVPPDAPPDLPDAALGSTGAPADPGAPDLPADVLAPMDALPTDPVADAPDLPPGLLEGAPDVASDPDVAVPPFDVDGRIFDDQWDALARRLATDPDLTSATTQPDRATPPDLPPEWLDAQEDHLHPEQRPDDE